MSPILINSAATSVTTSLSTAKVANLNTRKFDQSEVDASAMDSIDEEKNEQDTEIAREERKATGRSVAIVIFLLLMCLAMYHVIQKKTTILAGVLVPAFILFTYTFFMIHTSSREKKRLKQLETVNDLELSVPIDLVKQELQKKVSSPSMISASSASIPSTSGLSMTSTRNAVKVPMPTKIDPKTAKLLLEMKALKVAVDPNATPSRKVPPPFKKAQSHSHMQVKSNQSTTHVSIEHEKKKLKKSRSFDKNLAERHEIDSKKPKNKTLSRH